jgi:hypothetical protein
MDRDEIERLLSAAGEAALADTLAGLWAHVLGVRTTLIAAGDPPNGNGLDNVGRKLWTAALERWVKPIADQVWADSPPVVREQNWAALLQRAQWTVDLITDAISRTLSLFSSAPVDQLRDQVTRVLDMDAYTETLRTEIAEVESALLDPNQSNVDRGAQFSRRVRLSAKLFMLKASRARSKGYAALANVDPPERAREDRQNAQKASRPAADIRTIEREIAGLDDRLYHNPDLEPDKLAQLRAKLVRLNGEGQHGRETWRNTITRDARAIATGLTNSATLQYGLDRAQATGDEWVKQWVATEDDRTRPTHVHADGQVQLLAQPFHLGGGETGQPEALADFPGDFDLPPAEFWNCVVGSTQVDWPGQNVHTTTRRRFKGDFFEIVTARGHKLTVTPNHPILTTVGYVPAGLLCPGQYVLATDQPPAPEVDDGPPRIEQVQRTSLETGVTSRVAGATPQFHGDGTDSEIQVVRTDGSLWNSFNTEISGELDQESLFRRPTGAPVSAFGPGAASSRLDPIGTEIIQPIADSPGFVGGGSQSPALSSGHTGKPKSVGLAAVSNIETKLGQPSANYGTADSDFASHLQDALTLGMTACEIVEINRFTGDHDVFNLETTRGWYIGNGIAQHNCRCSMRVLSRAQFNALPADAEVSTDQVSLAASAQEVTPMPDDELSDLPPVMWHGVITKEGVYTGDARLFSPGAMRTAALPLPIRFQREDWGGHTGAVVTANLEGARRFGEDIRAWGTFADGTLTPEVDEVQGLMATRMIRGISIDGDDVLDSQFSIELNEHGDAFSVFDSMRLRAATFVAIPAYDGAEVYLGPPPADWHLEGEPLVVEQNDPGDTRPVSEMDDDELMGLLAASRVPENLAEYWTTGEGAAKIAWGTPGDFNRCRANLAQYVPPGQLSGMCANLHHRALGKWPGQEATLIARGGPLLQVYESTTETDWDFTAEQFAPRELDALTPVTIDDDGSVWGHLAGWETCHTAYGDYCQKPPRSATGYAMFHVGATRLMDGTDLPVGKLTVGAGHADPKLGIRAATAHYDNSAAAVAMIRVYEDQWGVQASGMIIPGTPREKIEELRRSPISGDWRPYRGNLELIAGLGVNSPGFPIPRVLIATAGGKQLSLVAAGYVARDLDAEVAELAARFAPTAAEMDERVAILAARITSPAHTEG